VWLRASAARFLLSVPAFVAPAFAAPASAAAVPAPTFPPLPRRRRQSRPDRQLRAVDNKYVVAGNGGAAALVANRDATGPWEKFTLVNG